MIGWLSRRAGALFRRWDVDVEAQARLPFARALALINLKRIEPACYVAFFTDLITTIFGTSFHPVITYPLAGIPIVAALSRRTLAWTSLKAQQAAVLGFVVVALVERMIGCMSVSRGVGRVETGYLLGMMTIAVLFVLRPRTLAIVLAVLLVPYAIFAWTLPLPAPLRLLPIVNGLIVAAIAVLAGGLIYGARRKDFAQKRLIQSQNARLTEQNEELDQLMAITAHDLRSPLYGLRNLLDLAVRRSPDDRDLAFRVMRDAIFSLDAMLLLVTRLLDAHSAEHAPVAATLRDDVRGPIEAAARRIAPAAEAADIKVVVDLPDTPLVACHDLGALNQVLDNLLANAVRFNPAGGRLRIAGAAIDGRVRIAVADEGPGLDAAARDRLFLKFANAAAGNAGAAGAKAGTGMGLFIAATYADRMGAELVYRDGEPRGALFELTLAA